MSSLLIRSHTITINSPMYGRRLVHCYHCSAYINHSPMIWLIVFQYDNTALHCAAHYGRSKVIRYLLVHGAEIEAYTRVRFFFFFGFLV